MSKVYVDNNMVSAFKVRDTEMDRLLQIAEASHLTVPAVARLLLLRALALPPPEPTWMAVEHARTVRALREGE